MADFDFDISQLDLASLNSGLSDLGFPLGGGDASGGDASGGDNAYALASSQGSMMIPPMKKASIAKAVRLLGAAVSYYGAGALQGILPSLAAVLGVQAGDLLVAFLGKRGRGRRRRGITYRQLSNARRVYGTIGRMYHALHKGEHHRRAPPPFRTRKGGR